jgi:hypothetical protein
MSKTDQQTTAPVKVPAGDVVVGDQVASKKRGPFAAVAEISDGPKSRRLTFDGGSSIRPRHVTPVWVQRPAVDPRERVAPTRKAKAAAVAADDQRQAQEAELKALLKKDQTSKDVKRVAELRAVLGLDGGKSSGGRKKAATKRDPVMAELASRANALGNPAARITARNMARVVKALGDRDPFDLVAPERRLKSFARGKGSLTDDQRKALREFGSPLGSDTFYGKKLASMLVAATQQDDARAKVSANA